MIISDTHRFAFVHIPKCAGTSVRSVLEPFDESGASMAVGLPPHPERAFTFAVGDEHDYRDFHHLTLRCLRDRFPREFGKLRDYRCYAILREPHERLVSSVAQRLKQFHRVAVGDLSATALEDAVSRTLREIEPLLISGNDLPYGYVHFERQSAFVELDGETVADRLFTTRTLQRMHGDLQRYLQRGDMKIAPFHETRANTTKTHRFALLRRFAEGSEGRLKAVKAILPQSAKPVLQRFVYRDRAAGDEGVRLEDGEVVRDFVRRHYGRDLQIWRHLRSRAA
ncbi:sulfotransferase family 2 domain-containing protein [Aurantiacibacter spongiae]|uniref:Sulfotransferase family protein n=1 Tax=Aurantiacibacter spongiae TaxID=2488860 RepID=A0A3N5DIN9_9SPHN|nr:sulfotransferase family 2 domain-containing protein [Aurantiacibacter spongiae]RPF71522.1 hypothetical protein EG799_07765 [Aurantiacibacter spongiae]